MVDEQKIQECFMQLKTYLERFSSDTALQDFLLSKNLELTLAEYAAGKRSDGGTLYGRFIVAGWGVRHELELEHSPPFPFSVYGIEQDGAGRVVGEYRFHLPNFVWPLAYAISRALNGEIAPEMLEEKIAAAIGKAKAGEELSLD